MRVYLRTFSLCIVIGLLSLVYLFSKHDAESFSPVLKQVRAPLEPSVAKNLNRVKSKQLPTATTPHTPRDVAHKVNSAGQREMMQLAVVACGDRHGEAVNMLKTAAMLSSRALRFHIFAEEQLHTSIKTALDSWPAFIRAKFSYVIHPISFPHEKHEEWSQLFKPCASQRLFLPMILKEVDSLLYVDTDVLFLQPVELIWDMLTHFNSTQLVAMAPEHEEPRIAWYSCFSRHPYYGKTGINSGAMLMNLTRMRMIQFKNGMTSVGLHWDELLMPLLQKYKLNITRGDQDLINIIFHYNPEMVFTLPCNWNYRPDHCIYGSNCILAEEEGVLMLHGNRGVFHSNKQPAFKAVYDAFKHYIFGEDLIKSFLLPLEEALNRTTHTYCGKVSNFFTRGLGMSARKIQRMLPAGG
ncbi:glucoside xylosyltransferase 1 isoform X1 [Cyprinus carpio]|uniref:UDP-D-xylose:beta-D-glucoside alpha-1,3-D-xylosyltransferase n=2 Tax=Cyprinus carpio TaxID=7962 RepID=A0A9Q9W6U5_CYPCA|nr:glucoside xylosyltransferase 1 isoform X1 [Cyprinus carpio]